MAASWTERNVPDQTGRHVLIIGATGGLGLARAKALVAALWKISEARTGTACA
ncbi:hypothetical protein [Salipiger bermudensis]|uniref:hypothetical protein n=1 Tax=Salipiger bermudensis TaxID=344736 RepID=UPI00300BD957